MRRSRLALKLTYRCPGRCPYCDARKNLWKVRGGRDMPLALVERIARRLESEPNQPFEEVALTGGEATMLKSFPDIARRLSATGLPLGVTTAGWANATGSWAELLTAVPFAKIGISLDHPDRDENDRLRRPGSWGRAVRAISEAVAARDRDGRPEVTVISVIHRHNIGSLEALAAQLNRWRVDRWMPAHLEATARYPDLAPTHADLDGLAAARGRSASLDAALGVAFDEAWVPRRLIIEGLWPEGQARRGCTVLGRLLVVHPNGAVYGCYGSEHAEVKRVGTLGEAQAISFGDLLHMARRTDPALCRGCPEPVQHSNALR